MNSETDFVARNSDFQAIVRAIAEVATGCADIEALQGAPLGDKTVEEAVTEKITTIGENLHLRRMVAVEGESVASYVHNAVAEDLGKIGVIVALKGADNGIGKQIAMHVAATSPASLSEADLDPALIEREKAMLTEQARESGKPEAVIEKMIARPDEQVLRGGDAPQPESSSSTPTSPSARRRRTPASRSSASPGSRSARASRRGRRGLRRRGGQDRRPLTGGGRASPASRRGRRRLGLRADPTAPAPERARRGNRR